MQSKQCGSGQDFCGVVWIGCIYVQPTGAAALGLLGCSFVHTVQSLWTKLRGLFFLLGRSKGVFFSIAFYVAVCALHATLVAAQSAITTGTAALLVAVRTPS